MKRLNRFFCAIAVFVTVFAFSCIPSFASNTVDFRPTMANPLWSYYPGEFSFYKDNIRSIPGKIDNSYYSQDTVYAPFDGIVESYSNQSMLGGYSYSGTFAVNFSINYDDAMANITGSGTKIEAKSTWAQVDKVEFVIDGNTYSPFLTKTSLTSGTAYLNVKDLYASADNRFIVKVYLSGYSWFNIGSSDHHGYIDRTYVQVNPNVSWVSNSYVIHGTTSGFKDNLTNFDNSMNEGSQKEDALTDKAIGDVNSFEFKDIKDDSSILSSLTFYSSVINLAYGSLGGSIQTLFAISFGVLIVIFILRIRRDSS